MKRITERRVEIATTVPETEFAVNCNRRRKRERERFSWKYRVLIKGKGECQRHSLELTVSLQAEIRLEHLAP